MNPSDELRARVLEAARREPVPSRAHVQARNAVLLVSGFVVPAFVFYEYGGLRGAPRPEALVLETAVGAAAIALAAGIIALRRGRSMLGRAGVTLLALALVTPVVLLSWKTGVSALFPAMMNNWPARAGFRCLSLGCLTAAWPLVAIVLARRGSDPTHPRLTGAAIGAAVGACSWVFVDLWCPVAYVPHLLVGHVLPVVLTTLAGTWLGGRFIALRGPSR